MKKKYDIGIIGDLCANDITVAEAVAQHGLKVVVFRKRQDKSASASASISNYNSYLDAFDSRDIYHFASSWDLFCQLRQCRVAFNFTNAMLAGLRCLYPLKFCVSFPPVINYMSGADITEYIAASSFRSLLYRLHLKTSKFNWCPPYPHALKNVLRYRLPNVHFMRFMYCLHTVADSSAEKTIADPGAKLRFFHPSHFDWKEADSDESRNSSKGNDRFLRAFIRAVKSGLNAECVILDRGPDRRRAREIVDGSGVKTAFVWKKHLERDRLFVEYKHADVIVDQFDVGGLGMIAMEAMSCGKPVITYFNSVAGRILYGDDLPPVLNCWSEEEIYDAIMSCRQRELLRTQGENARSWVIRNHHWAHCMDEFLFYYALLTGRTVKDYGWERSAYAEGKRR